jgi:hypothetical protein
MVSFLPKFQIRCLPGNSARNLAVRCSGLSSRRGKYWKSIDQICRCDAPGGLFIRFRSGNIDRVFHLGPIHGDESGTGKMSDAYLIVLFRLEHVIKLILGCCNAEALYILPWALIFQVFLSSVMSRMTRTSILNLGLRFLTPFCNDADDLTNPILGSIPVDRTRIQQSPGRQVPKQIPVQRIRPK